LIVTKMQLLHAADYEEDAKLWSMAVCRLGKKKKKSETKVIYTNDFIMQSADRSHT